MNGITYFRITGNIDRIPSLYFPQLAILRARIFGKSTTYKLVTLEEAMSPWFVTNMHLTIMFDLSPEDITHLILLGFKVKEEVRLEYIEVFNNCRIFGQGIRDILS